jgi:hypothetical protein
MPAAAADPASRYAMPNNPPTTMMMMMMMMTRLKTRMTRAAGVVLFAAQLCACGCASQPAQPSNQAKPAINSAVVRSPLENGAYAVLGEAATRPHVQTQDVQTQDVETTNAARPIVLTYDRRRYSDAPPDEPLTYVEINPADYVPLIIEKPPEMKKDSQGKSILSVSFTNADLALHELFHVVRSHCCSGITYCYPARRAT